MTNMLRVVCRFEQFLHCLTGISCYVFQLLCQVVCDDMLKRTLQMHFIPSTI